jgi:hypothetical protein
MFELLGGIAIGFLLCIALIVGSLAWLLKKAGGIDVVTAKLENETEKVKRETQAIADQSIGVIVEREQGHYYFYNEKNNAFIGQGETVKEVRDIMRKRYPNATVYLSSASDEVTAMIKRELKELAKQ